MCRPAGNRGGERRTKNSLFLAVTGYFSQKQEKDQHMEIEGSSLSLHSCFAVSHCFLSFIILKYESILTQEPDSFKIMPEQFYSGNQPFPAEPADGVTVNL